MDVNKLKIVMKEKKLTQRKLAELSGVSAGVLSRILSGIYQQITIQTLIRIADALEVLIDDIVIRKWRNND
mgnify:CR=1 FL=1